MLSPTVTLEDAAILAFESAWAATNPVDYDWMLWHWRADVDAALWRLSNSKPEEF